MYTWAVVAEYPVRVELKRVDLDTKSRDVFLFELARQVALYECGLSHTAITHEHKLQSYAFSSEWKATPHD